MIANINLEELPDYITYGDIEIKPRLDYDSIEWLDNYFQKRGEQITGLALLLSFGAERGRGSLRVVDQLRVIWLSIKHELKGVTFDEFKKKINEELKWKIIETAKNAAICLKTSFMLDFEGKDNEGEKKNGQSKKITSKPLESESSPANSGS